jgi:hypothetical protein
MPQRLNGYLVTADLTGTTCSYPEPYDHLTHPPLISLITNHDEALHEETYKIMALARRQCLWQQSPVRVIFLLSENANIDPTKNHEGWVNVQDMGIDVVVFSVGL